MWLTLDIGNTAVKGGLFDGDRLVRSFRLASRPDASVPAYRHSLRAHLQDDVVERVGLASVVPALTRTLAEAVRQEKMVLPEAVHAGMTLPFEMGYRTPETLGADRLAAATAGYLRYGRAEDGAARAVIVVSAGTAVAYDVVDAGGTYRGGAIGCGPQLARDALARGTAQLPEARLDLPRRPIGRSTRKSLQSGVMFGFIDGAAGMIRRLRRQVRGPAVVVATGGWSALLGEQLKTVDHVEPTLVLHGVRALLASDE